MFNLNLNIAPPLPIYPYGHTPVSHPVRGGKCFPIDRVPGAAGEGIARVYARLGKGTLISTYYLLFESWARRTKINGHKLGKRVRLYLYITN